MRRSLGPARSRPCRTRLGTASLLAVVVGVGASGCSLLPFGAVGGPSTQTLADGSTFLVNAPTNAFDEALVSGQLALIGGDCIGMEDPAGAGQGDVLTFPSGTRPSKDGRSIVLPDGLEVTVGDQVYGGGGYTELSENPGVLDSWPDAPAGCRGAGTAVSIYDVKLGEAPRG